MSKKKINRLLKAIASIFHVLLSSAVTSLISRFSVQEQKLSLRQFLESTTF